jgi:hypothetical protein
LTLRFDGNRSIGQRDSEACTSGRNAPGSSSADRRSGFCCDHAAQQLSGLSGSRAPIFSVQSSAEAKPVKSKATGDANSIAFFRAVFVSSAGATSMTTLHPTPIEARLSHGERRTSKTLAA